jgi:ABC-type dipeptide/oligopeptide/nickel transport system ATPase component
LVTPPMGCRYHPRCEKMMAGLCDTEVPPEFVRDNDHLVSCWLYK